MEWTVIIMAACISCGPHKPFVYGQVGIATNKEGELIIIIPSCGVDLLLKKTRHSEIRTDEENRLYWFVRDSSFGSRVFLTEVKKVNKHPVKFKGTGVGYMFSDITVCSR